MIRNWGYKSEISVIDVMLPRLILFKSGSSNCVGRAEKKIPLVFYYNL